MFSFLSRATTGLASRAYADGGDEIDSKQRLSDAASPAFSVALFCGLVLSLTYTLRASNVLNLLRGKKERGDAFAFPQIQQSLVYSSTTMFQQLTSSFFRVRRNISNSGGSAPGLR